jgi:hypothetical protein
MKIRAGEPGGLRQDDRPAAGTYRVHGQASSGIFAGARGTGNVTVDPTTGHDTASGTLILRSPEA